MTAPPGRSASVVRDAPAIVFGDFNSGTSLVRFGSSSRHHQRLVDEFDALGLVSAYHAFHRVGHGYESDATYFHQFNAASRGTSTSASCRGRGHRESSTWR